MHHILNLTDLFTSLWRGTLYAEGADDKTTWDFAVFRDANIWKSHGAAVARATPYFPGSFDRPPRNPAEKINSGYKAWEFLLWFFVLGPGHFRACLPKKYWQHFCQLVFAIRIIQQRTVTHEQLIEAHKALIQFCDDFELLYYQRAPERIHFVRQSIHQLIHLSPESLRMGPLWAYTQWTMERFIGDLGAEICQPSNPFANLSQRNVLCAQINALKAMLPDLEKKEAVPRGSYDVGEGYRLLAAHDSVHRPLRDVEFQALVAFLEKEGENVAGVTVTTLKTDRWARVQLPNGQIARSAWKENRKALENLRISRMIKVDHVFGEVRFFFRLQIHGKVRVLALVSTYSDIDKTLYEESFRTLAVCSYRGDEGLTIVDVQSIESVVSMQPLPMTREEAAVENAHKQYGNRWFVGERPGLDIALFMSVVARDDMDGELGDVVES
ncbi:hypothetical protein BXZ70DRAFT_899236 [Cristinia sonorae]|uniref:Uncharacterized protein n=1 Tax=Cristinia sonorae TaxID=1940300 RepID=A0A8K0UIM2_9AGAR|nr:hypothetical protein BXZ70DRAFT_899236 [Cristinia sonorae]